MNQLAGAAWWRCHEGCIIFGHFQNWHPNKTNCAADNLLGPWSRGKIFPTFYPIWRRIKARKMRAEHSKPERRKSCGRNDPFSRLFSAKCPEKCFSIPRRDGFVRIFPNSMQIALFPYYPLPLALSHTLVLSTSGSIVIVIIIIIIINIISGESSSSFVRTSQTAPPHHI